MSGILLFLYDRNEEEEENEVLFSGRVLLGVDDDADSPPLLDEPKTRGEPSPLEKEY